MRFKRESFEEKTTRLAEWRKVFVWWPLSIDDEIIWLEWIERQSFYHEFFGEWRHYYRDVQT